MAYSKKAVLDKSNILNYFIINFIFNPVSVTFIISWPLYLFSFHKWFNFFLINYVVKSMM